MSHHPVENLNTKSVSMMTHSNNNPLAAKPLVLSHYAAPGNLFRLNFVYAGTSGFVYVGIPIAIRPPVFQLLYWNAIDFLPAYATSRPPRKLWLFKLRIRLRGGHINAMDKTLAPLASPPRP
ncbi:hypothetical protein PG988_003481 [Apiospora saccharicola]